MLRPSAAFSAAKASVERARHSARRAVARFARPSAFSLPAGRVAASSRLSRNLASFRAHYSIIVWFSLLATLFPSHRTTMLFLMAISKIALSYTVLLRLFPNSGILHRILDRRIVVALFIAFVIIQVALAGAFVNLFLALGAAAPFIFVHAVFRSSDDPSAAGAADSGLASGELTTLFEKKDGDLETGGAHASDRST